MNDETALKTLITAAQASAAEQQKRLAIPIVRATDTDLILTRTVPPDKLRAASALRALLQAIERVQAIITALFRSELDDTGQMELDLVSGAVDDRVNLTLGETHTTTILANGPYFGKQGDELDIVIRLLQQHVLDREYEPFIYADRNGLIRFRGSFLELAHAFDLYTDHAPIAERLALLINANRSRADYQAQRPPVRRVRVPAYGMHNAIRVEQLEAGDKVVSAGGILHEVVKIEPITTHSLGVTMIAPSGDSVTLRIKREKLIAVNRGSDRTRGPARTDGAGNRWHRPAMPPPAPGHDQHPHRGESDAL